MEETTCYETEMEQRGLEWKWRRTESIGKGTELICYGTEAKTDELRWNGEE